MVERRWRGWRVVKSSVNSVVAETEIVVVTGLAVNVRVVVGLGSETVTIVVNGEGTRVRVVVGTTLPISVTVIAGLVSYVTVMKEVV